jgi:Tfp pilus assembly PilM family ATPase
VLDLRARYPIGIDIGDQYIYAAQLKPDKDGMAVRGLWRREFDAFTDGLPDDEDALVTALKGITKSRRFQGRSAVIHLPSQIIISMPIQFEKREDESVEEGIFKETAKHLSFPIEDAILDYPSISESSSDDQSEYSATVVVAQKDYIHRYVSILKKAGLSVEAVDFGVCEPIPLAFVVPPSACQCVLDSPPQRTVRDRN